MRFPVSGVFFAVTMDHNYAISPARVPTKQSNPATTNNIKPLTERQQMALLLQMTAEASPVSNSPNTTPKSLIRRNERGETPLHVAAIRGDLEKVIRLVRQGVDVNTTDFAGWSPLHEAANRGHTAIVRELLLAGASVNASGLDNVTPLHDAAVNGHDKIVNLLLRHGANANLTTSGNKTALDLAASPEIINLLAKGTAEATDDDRSSEADENSPVFNRFASTPTNGTSAHTPWRVRTVNNPKQRKSRRNLIMDPTNSEALPVTDNTTELIADTLNLDVMESSNAGAPQNATEERESKLVASDSKASSNHEDVTSKEEAKEGETAETAGQAQKRTLDAEEDVEEESKRKRKKGDEAKETKGGRVAAPRGKQMDRKSPNTVQTDSNHSIPESDEDGRKGNELKVPPLKIVLSSNTTEADTAGTRAKSSNGRGTLPYVVASNDEKAEGSASEKDEKPKDSLGDLEKTVSTGGRVTRSSQRAAATANNQATPTTSGPNSASQSPTCSPVQNASGNLNGSLTPPTPATESSETPAAPVLVANVTPAVTKEPVKVEEVKQEEQPVEVHPRKRKLRVKEPEPAPEPPTANQTLPQPEPVPQAPMSNPYDMYFSIRKQIERRHRNLIPVQPKPPQGFKDYLMNRCTYVIASNAAARLSVPVVSPPPTLPPPMRDLFAGQEKERYRLRMQHLIEKEKLVLSVEQEILRVHGRAARALANQSLPFSVCTLLKDQEVYSALTPEQEEKDRNARSRYNGRLFLSWLQDVDDKWEKIKDSMLLRHHNEAESLHAVQRMDWEWKLKDLALCDPQTKPVIEELHVPMVHVSDDFDLLPA